MNGCLAAPHPLAAFPSSALVILCASRDQSQELLRFLPRPEDCHQRHEGGVHERDVAALLQHRSLCQCQQSRPAQRPGRDRREYQENALPPLQGCREVHAGQSVILDYEQVGAVRDVLQAAR